MKITGKIFVTSLSMPSPDSGIKTKDEFQIELIVDGAQVSISTNVLMKDVSEILIDSITNLKTLNELTLI